MGWGESFSNAPEPHYNRLWTASWTYMAIGMVRKNVKCLDRKRESSGGFPFSTDFGVGQRGYVNGGVKLSDDGASLEPEIISPEGSRVSHEAKAREGNYFACDIPFDEIGEFR